MKFILIVASSLLLSTLAKPHKHRQSSDDEGAKQAPKKAFLGTSTKLSDVQSLTWKGQQMGMRIPQQEDFMASTPFHLSAIFSNSPRTVMPVGSMRMQAIELSQDTLLSLHFTIRRNVTFATASLRFQLEGAGDEMSAIVSLHIDTFSSICQERGTTHMKSLHCTSSGNLEEDERAPHIIDGIPVPSFKDFKELPQSGVGSLHLWLEDDQGEFLMESRIFATKEEEE